MEESRLSYIDNKIVESFVMKNLIVKTLELNDSSSKSDSAIGGDCPSKCGFCSHYQFQGRQGGNCELLNITVRGGWNACALGQSRFTSCGEDTAWMKRLPGEVLN
jgi:hypothetical protein